MPALNSVMTEFSNSTTPSDGTGSGYAGGKFKNPTYEQVSSGLTDHYESVQALFDPAKIRYERLLEVFRVNIDPIDGSGQFRDRGKQYRTAIFHHDEEQRRLAEQSKAEIERSGKLRKPIETEIRSVNRFSETEGYHQDFYKTKLDRCKSYRTGCGRDRRLKELWG